MLLSDRLTLKRWAKRLIKSVFAFVHIGLKKAHHHAARRPHNFFYAKLKHYRRWHDWRWHPHVHLATLSAYLLFIGALVFQSLNPSSISALSAWTQTDWSGGSASGTVTGTVNTYSSITNLVTSTAGQLTLSPVEQFSNYSLDATNDLDNWLGVNPSSIAGLSFHSKADAGVFSDSGTTPASNGQDVQQWNDQSGNSHHAAAPSSTRRPTLNNNQVNGRPALSFGPDVDTAGNSDTLDSTVSSVSSLSDATYFVVGSFDYTNQPATNYDYLFSVYNSTNPTASGVGSIARQASNAGNPDKYYTFYNSGALLGPVLTSGFKLFTQQFNNTSPRHYLWLDRVAQTVDTAGSQTTINNVKLTLGKWQNGTWALNGRLAEFLMYSSSLNTADRHHVENYLNNKYNLGTSNLSIDTTTKRTGAGSAKMVTGSETAELLQNLNVGDTLTYNLAAYVYTDGSAVTSADAELYYNGAAVSTTYASAGGGWYRLSGTVTGANASRAFGVQVKANKTAYIDDMSLTEYSTSGSLISNILDASTGHDWLTANYTVSGTGSASLKARSSNNSDMSGATAFASCSAINSGANISTGNCVTNNHRYLQYELSLSGSGSSTPVLEDLTLNMEPSDTTAPITNASSIQMLKSAGGTSVASNGWTNGTSPYFSWTAGSDDVGGSGLKGYCLYLGQDSTGNPTTSKGILGTSPISTNGSCQFVVSVTNIDLATAGYIGTALSTSSSPYYLNIKAIDNAHNVFGGASTQFQFRFDNTAPGNPAYISAPSQFVATKAVTLTWPTAGGDSASDSNAGVAGLQYRIGSSGTWYGDSHNGNQDSSDLLSNDGSYTTQDNPDFANLVEGNNVVYFRTWDGAGNTSTAQVTTVIKINTTSPGSPQNVTSTPSTNTTNSFAFSWLPPASFSGNANSLTYCYTVNAAPTLNNCSFTSVGTTSLSAGAYATQPGDNTFYVVAKDEAGNINYATAATTTFTANTSAPGMPLNLEIADVSTKTTSSWKLALSWNPPSDVGAGVASYKIFRSTDSNNYAQIATTAGTSHVDSNLNQVTYYYKVRACDSANNCGALSSAVSKQPTGRFTSPAELISNPSIQISTRKATITWVTDRNSDSRIQFGKSSGDYFATEAASSDQVKSHSIELTNLDAGTTYYYKAKWTDEDGNVGSSSELSFTTLPAPTIKDVSIQRTTLSTAIIKFTSKDAVQVKMFYGKNETFGGLQTVNTSRSESSYTVELTGLDDGTTYFYKLNPIDADGNEYDSARVDSFGTPARPRILNLSFQPIEGEPSSTQKVSWDTNVPTSSLVRYSPSGGANKELVISELTTDHEVIIKGLLDDTDYSLVAESRDKDGNVALSDTQAFRTALDTRPPRISDINIETAVRGNGAEARGQIVVSWKTDEPATSQVAYGEGSGTAYTSQTAEDVRLTTDHVLIISDLSTSKVYHLQPLSKDKAGNQSSGTDQSAIIGRASESVLNIILNSLQKIFGL